MNKGKKKEMAPTYTGVTKEELAAQQRQYEGTIGLLSSQNSELSARFGGLQKQYEEDYGKKFGLLSSQLSDQKGYYDSLLTNANASLEQSRAQTAASADQYGKLDEIQKKQLALQEAEQTRGSFLQRQEQTKLTNQVAQSSSSRGTQQKRRARASLLRPNTGT